MTAQRSKAAGLARWSSALASAATVLVFLSGCRDVAEPALATPGVAHDRSKREALPFLLGGVQVAEPDRERWLEALTASGFNTVAVTVYALHGDWNGDQLRFEEDAPAVVSEVRAAKARGMRVVLILRLALDQTLPGNRFLWHGMIMPATDELLHSWFRKYRRFALRWARIAQEEGIDVLGIGSELSALSSTVPVDSIPELEAWYLDREKQAAYVSRLEALGSRVDPSHLRRWGHESYDSARDYMADRAEAQRRWAAEVTGLRGGARSESEAVRFINRRRETLREAWESLIAALRREYGGRLTYAANFDQYHTVSFWPRLDMMGINAYFSLRGHSIDALPEADLGDQLQTAWERILERIDAVRRQAAPGIPVLFTELGYTFRAPSTLEPWAADGFSLIGEPADAELVVWRERPVDYDERAMAVAALRRARSLVDPAMLRGILYWKLSTRLEHEAIEPFVLVLGREPADPLLGELQRLTSGL